MNDNFRWEIFNDFVGDKVMTWGFVVYQFFFIIFSISSGEVGLTGRGIGRVA
jgi:hypothetical protein